MVSQKYENFPFLENKFLKYGFFILIISHHKIHSPIENIIAVIISKNKSAGIYDSNRRII